ncbi:MAG TPA: hypothetical protein DDZ89_15155, partial [Clostridiales bacterium]|nr:hypothetical protein [Clostridiales bacterium]
MEPLIYIMHIIICIERCINMGKFIVRGGRPLNGSVKIQGSKNAVLPIIAASLLNKGTCTLKNCPNLRDVNVAIEILNIIGAETTFSDHI